MERGHVLSQEGSTLDPNKNKKQKKRWAGSRWLLSAITAFPGGGKKGKKRVRGRCLSREEECEQLSFSRELLPLLVGPSSGPVERT